MKYTKREFEKLLKDKLTSECNVTLDTASADQIYRCLASVTRQIKDYLEDAASAKMAAEETRRENASLKRRIDELERRLRRAQTPLEDA